MALREHPALGSLVMCDFNTGFAPPEMVKRRLVAVLSPKIGARKGLCTVVSLSTSAPDPIMPYHCQIDIQPPLPVGMASQGVWVKGDMLAVVSLQRLDFVRTGKSQTGRREYYYSTLSNENIKKIRSVVLAGMGMAHLTKHL